MINAVVGGGIALVLLSPIIWQVVRYLWENRQQHH